MDKKVIFYSESTLLKYLEIKGKRKTEQNIKQFEENFYTYFGCKLVKGDRILSKLSDKELADLSKEFITIEMRKN